MAQEATKALFYKKIFWVFVCPNARSSAVVIRDSFHFYKKKVFSFYDKMQLSVNPQGSACIVWLLCSILKIFVVVVKIVPHGNSHLFH